jgi:hypothetical protein
VSNRLRAAILRVTAAHPLAALIFGHLVLRLAILATGIESVAFDEELYRGAVAKELIDGLKIPLASYRPDPYSGGFLLVALLAVPGFMLFGPTLLALKLVPLAFSLGILALLFVFLDRSFGRRAAIAGGVLFVCSPPGPTQLSLVAMGFHTESVFFSLLILLAWYRFLADPARPVWLAVFGLAVGSGISFTYITAVTGVACLAAGLLVAPRPTPRAVGCMILGLIVGLLPWTVYNVTHGFEGVHWVGELLRPQLVEAGRSPLSVLHRLVRKAVGVVLIGLPQSYALPSMAMVPARALSYVYWLVGVVIVGVMLARQRRVPANMVPLFLCAGLLVAAFVLTGYDVPRHEAALGFINFRFFAPLQVVTLTLAAVSLAGRRWGVAVLLILAGLGLLGQGMLLSRDVPRLLLVYRGYSYVQIGQVWAARLYPRSQTFAEAIPLLTKFPEPARRLVFWGLLDNTQGRWPDPLAAIARIGEIPTAYRIHFAEALGSALSAMMAPERLAAVADSLAPAEREYLYRGYGTNVSNSWTDLWRLRGEFDRQAPSFRRWFYFRLGALVATAC